MNTESKAVKTLVELYGTTKNGEMVYAYTLCAGRHRLRILNYGAILLDWLVFTSKGSLQTPDGLAENVVLTLENLKAYEHNPAYVGCVVGRYGGRMKEARVRTSADHGSQDWTLEANDRGNCLHGGHVGFGRRLWRCEKHTDQMLELSYVSPDGEAGFRGALNVTVRYCLDDEGTLSVTFLGESQVPTVFAPTHHAYFNLASLEQGQKPDVSHHRLQVSAKGILETDETAAPCLKVTDQALLEAFTGVNKGGQDAQTVGQLSALTNAFFKAERGLDYPFELVENTSTVLTDAEGRRKLTVTTECPYVVIYAGGWLEQSIPLNTWGGHFIQALAGTTNPAVGWGAVPYNGICFETQEMPNGPQLEGVGPWWVSPETPYRRTTWYKISLEE